MDLCNEMFSILKPLKDVLSSLSVIGVVSLAVNKECLSLDFIVNRDVISHNVINYSLVDDTCESTVKIEKSILCPILKALYNNICKIDDGVYSFICFPVNEKRFSISNITKSLVYSDKKILILM